MFRELNKLPKISLKSKLVYTCDFQVATSARQKLHRVAATKIACVNGPLVDCILFTEINRFCLFLFLFLFLLCFCVLSGLFGFSWGKPSVFLHVLEYIVFKVFKNYDSVFGVQLYRVLLSLCGFAEGTKTILPEIGPDKQNNRALKVSMIQMESVWSDTGYATHP